MPLTYHILIVGISVKQKNVSALPVTRFSYSFGNISTVPQETTMFFQTNYRNIFCLGEVSLSAPFSCVNAVSILVTFLLPFCKYDLEVTLPRWLVSLFKCIEHPTPMDSELPSCQQGPIYPTPLSFINLFSFQF